MSSKALMRKSFRAASCLTPLVPCYSGTAFAQTALQKSTYGKMESSRDSVSRYVITFNLSAVTIYLLMPAGLSTVLDATTSCEHIRVLVMDLINFSSFCPNRSESYNFIEYSVEDFRMWPYLMPISVLAGNG